VPQQFWSRASFFLIAAFLLGDDDVPRIFSGSLVIMSLSELPAAQKNDMVVSLAALLLEDAGEEEDNGMGFVMSYSLPCTLEFLVLIFVVMPPRPR